MHRSARPGIVSLTICAFLIAGSAVAQTAKISVQAGKPGPRISPLLYGIFFEEINRAGDGGLYAEMIQNRSFEDGRSGDEAAPAKMPGWTLVKRAAVAGPREPVFRRLSSPEWA